MYWCQDGPIGGCGRCPPETAMRCVILGFDERDPDDRVDRDGQVCVLGREDPVIGERRRDGNASDLLRSASREHNDCDEG
jgi:hypothetical protein